MNEREAFAAAKEIGTDAAWDAFLTRFPEGFYADMARAAREKLARGSESDSIPPSVEPATPSPLGGEVFEADMELNTDRPGYDYRELRPYHSRSTALQGAMRGGSAVPLLDLCFAWRAGR